MDYSRTEIGTGLMILTAALLAAVVIFVVGDFKDLFTPRLKLEVLMKDSHGIKRYAEVRHAGVDVGEVTSIGLKEAGADRVILEVEVRRDAGIQEGSRARVKTLGFLGERYVDIQPPEAPGRLLEEGDQIPGINTVPLEDIGVVLDELTFEIKQTRSQIDDLLADEAFKEDLKTTVKHAGEVAAELKEILADNRTALGETVESTRSATSEIDSLLRKHRKDLSSAMRNLSSLAEKLDGMADDLDALASKGRGLLDRNDQKIDETIADLRITAKNVRQLTADLKRRPYRLIKIFPDIFGRGGGEDADEDEADGAPAATNPAPQP